MSTMYVLGDGAYVFSSSTTVPRTVTRDTDFPWAQQDRIGRSPAQQDGVGGKDVFKFNGVLFPGKNKSGKEQLSAMRLEAGKKQPLVLADGDGWVYGRWVITKIRESRSHLWPNSNPRKVGFEMNLLYYGEDNESRDDLSRYI